MMDTVLVTQEQFETLESVKRLDKDYGWLLEAHAEDCWQWMNELKGFNGMSLGNLAKALYTEEYEIEQPTLKIGDFVVIDYGEYGQVFSRIKDWIDKKAGTFYVEKGHVAGNLSNTRQASPEDFYWFKDLDRKKVNDFHFGDVIKRSGCGDGVMSVVDGIEDGLTIQEAINFTKNEDFLGIYPADSFKPYPKEN